VNAALEVFSEFPFRDATTDEIARRAQVSKRDIYALFSNKNALLIAVVEFVLQADEENFSRAIAAIPSSSPLEERLQVVGLGVVSEILSPTTGFLCRLVASESLQQPGIGAIYFDSRYVSRSKAIAQMLASHHPGVGPETAGRAAKDYFALTTHLPQMAMLAGMRNMWNAESVESHVREAVESFLRAYPLLSEGGAG
jgi:AcrR family transcriptional regulator